MDPHDRVQKLAPSRPAIAYHAALARFHRRATREGDSVTTKDDIRDAIEGIDARIGGLRDRILAGGEQQLTVADQWRVRDALSHLAARSNGVQRVVDRARAAEAGGSPAQPPTGVDDINAAQVAERTDRSVEALLDEIRDGHRAAIAAVAELDDELLGREIAIGFRPGVIQVADMMLRGGPGHEGTHLDDIEASLGA